MTAGIYLHIPFCKSRCSYCDFATEVYRDSDAVERYVVALTQEIEAFPCGKSIDTIYFGGGTPSLLSASQLEKVFVSINKTFCVEREAEITLEMNPATVSLETLRGYRSLGVNRASFGLQTFDDVELKRLARGHNVADALDTFGLLRQAGFDNISFDLIAGLPRQTLADWQRNLNRTIELLPEHISLYLLEIHQGTPLATQIESERQPLPDAELAADMYEMMLDKLAAAGYRQYEISNFARDGLSSRHNSKYWEMEAVFGFGVSAHSFDGIERYANTRDTAEYVRRISGGRSAENYREKIDQASEAIFLGLRMTDGIELNGILEKYGDAIAEFVEIGLVAVSDKRLKLTRKGMLFSNEVFAAFV